METLEKWKSILDMLNCENIKRPVLADYAEHLQNEQIDPNSLATNLKLLSSIKNHKNLDYSILKKEQVKENIIAFSLEASPKDIGEDRLTHLINKKVSEEINQKLNESLITSKDKVKLKIYDLLKEIKIVEEFGSFRVIVKSYYDIDSSYLKEQALLESKEYNGHVEAMAFVANFKNNLERKVLEESKEYYWLRLYLREELENIEKGNVVRIRYAPTEEILETTFVCYEKKGQTDQHFSDIIEYIKEDDKRTLCLMIDVSHVNKGKNIDTLKKLFKFSHFYEEVILRREDLRFEVQSNDQWTALEYFDADF